MSAQAKTLEDLKDSRIMFDKEIPPFGYMLVLIVFFAMVGIIIWSTFAHKAYMVRAEGSVTSSDSNYVMPSFTGEIAQSYMEEGKLVQKGDILFVVKSLDFDLQEEQLADSRKITRNRLPSTTRWHKMRWTPPCTNPTVTPTSRSRASW